jgi:hypothetical protein
MLFGVPLRSILVVLCLGQLAACTSFDEDTPDHVDFALPSVAWSISAGDPQWRASPPPGAIPSFVCGGPQASSTDCCAASLSCQKYPLACDSTTGFCALTFDVELAQTVDLVDTTVTAVRGLVFSRVELQGLASTVASHDMPIRSASVYVGPKDLASSSDPAATFLAHVVLAPGEHPVTIDEPARSDLLSLVRDYQTPFALLLAVHVVAPAGFDSQAAFETTLKGSFRAFY